MTKKVNIPQVPLAERIRPKNLDEFQGQNHLVGPGKPLRVMIENDTLSSIILWGPPGTGKTTLAKIIAENTNSEFIQLNAVSSGVKDLRNVIEKAKENQNYSKRTILFIDEIHRYNKAQQDALLSSVEKGEIILIGATTENPSFEIISALRSRVRIFILNELTKNDLQSILNRALVKDEFLSSVKIKIEDPDYLIFISGGDARIMLNILEASVIQEINNDEIVITQKVIQNVLQKKNIIYDKSGEEHYNLISAFIKSIRGSDPDAAVYWLARMLEGGEDPLFIARRMVILASEDIGNAMPNALVLAEATFSACEKIGMPEARIILSQCATYLASAPKSNASYLAIDNAIHDVNTLPQYPVPFHLRNAPTNFMKEAGYGTGYKYPHNFENHFVEENYLPEEIKNKQYYFPTENGMEKTIKERLKSIWKNRKKY
ncbi:MAG: replication-associated recombination protein A [Melioribacter sp.]|uniref:replication-associated recombination protein A n=1 Tax=Rosettibacter primus TaxID=3111523 RepID=UPI00247C0D0B|nr:replication-associated recombination protein A [Melioribacter sp.]